MVEDLFSENAYASVISQVISARRHKDFRKINFGKKGTVGAIKEYIENNYTTFDDTYYAKFKSVLDKLLELFNL